jgi:hypothetical protein
MSPSLLPYDEVFIQGYRPRPSESENDLRRYEGSRSHISLDIDAFINAENSEASNDDHQNPKNIRYFIWIETRHFRRPQLASSDSNQTCCFRMYKRGRNFYFISLHDIQYRCTGKHVAQTMQTIEPSCTSEEP